MTEEQTPAIPNRFLKDLRRRIAGYRGMKRFATLCGLPYTTYRNYEMGRNRVPFSAASAIAAATGEDPTAIMSAGAEAAAEPAPEVKPREFALHSRGRVRLRSFREARDLKSRIAAAVTAEEYGKGDDFLRGGNRLALTAGDDSMAPLVAEGDLLIFDTKAKPGSGAIVCASLGGEMLVARYFRDGKRKALVLQPENRAFPPLVLFEGRPEAKKMAFRGVLISLRRTSFGGGEPEPSQIKPAAEKAEPRKKTGKTAARPPKLPRRKA